MNNRSVEPDSEQCRDTQVQLDPAVQRIRRIVTGHDAQGRSIILADEVSPHVMSFMGVRGFAVTELWRNASTPADNAAAIASDPCRLPIVMKPPVGGSVLRVTQFPPEKTWRLPGTDEGAAHPHLHRTQTLDYAIVLSGEIWVVLEQGEALLRAGDVIVQRGTRHAWANRSDAPSVVLFVMIDALPIGASP